MDNQEDTPTELTEPAQALEAAGLGNFEIVGEVEGVKEEGMTSFGVTQAVYEEIRMARTGTEIKRLSKQYGLEDIVVEQIRQA